MGSANEQRAHTHARMPMMMNTMSKAATEGITTGRLVAKPDGAKAQFAMPITTPLLPTAKRAVLPRAESESVISDHVLRVGFLMKRPVFGAGWPTYREFRLRSSRIEWYDGDVLRGNLPLTPCTIVEYCSRLMMLRVWTAESRCEEGSLLLLYPFDRKDDDATQNMLDWATAINAALDEIKKANEHEEAAMMATNPQKYHEKYCTYPSKLLGSSLF